MIAPPTAKEIEAMQAYGVTDVTLLRTQRETVTVAKYNNGRTPADGEPDDMLIGADIFTEGDGTVITDPGRIAAIRALQEQILGGTHGKA
jgi:hypothetical protein